MQEIVSLRDEHVIVYAVMLPCDRTRKPRGREVVQAVQHWKMDANAQKHGAGRPSSYLNGPAIFAFTAYSCHILLE
jgi:hypothetical protein